MFIVQEKNDKLKLNEAKLDDEKNQLQLNLGDAENQLMKTELLRQSLEGDVQRLRLVLGDRETENQVLTSRAENLTGQVHDLENKTQSLTANIERLNFALARTEQQESAQRNKVDIVHSCQKRS